MITNNDFLTAAMRGDILIIRKALNQGFDINQPTSNGQTALHIACVYGHTELVKFLINNKADCAIKDKYENTSLSVATSYADHPNRDLNKYISIINMLLNKTNNDTEWREICRAITILGKRNQLLEEDYQILYQLTFYKNWHIKIKVIRVLISHDNIPKYLITRVIDMKTCDHPNIEVVVDTFITTHKIGQFSLIETIQNSGAQLWNYLTATSYEDNIPLLTNN